MNSTKLRLNTLYHDIVFQYQYYQVVRYVVSFIVSVIMVRSLLPQADLGRYELMTFIITSISSFWLNGVKNAYISYYNHVNEDKKQKLPFTVFLLLSAIALVSGIVLFLFPEILKFFSAESLIPYLSIIVLYLFFFATIPLIDTIFLLQKNSKQLFAYTHWSQLGFLTLTIFTAIFYPTLQAFITVLLIWAGIRWFYLLFVVLAPFRITIDKQLMYFFAVFSLPLTLNMVLGSMMEMIDGWFVTRYFSTDFFPVFRYGAREMPISSLLFGSLSLAMIPLLTDDMANLSILKAKATRHMHILAPLSLILMIISPIVFVWFYGEAYQESAYIFNLYLLIMISRVMMPQTICFAKHQHAIIIWSGLLEILSNIIFSYWLLQYWGVYGLAAGTIIAFTLQKIILILYNYRKNGIRITEYVAIKPFLIYAILLIVTFFITLKF